MAKFQDVLEIVTDTFHAGAVAEDAWDDSENESYLIKITSLIMEKTGH